MYLCGRSKRSTAVSLAEILLPSYQSDPRPVYALYTEKDKLPLKVQVCINYLTEYFVDVAKIYQGMHGRGSPGGQFPAAPGTVSDQAVPPTVRLSTFRVGWPTPTGTLWPSLPQTPTPLSVRGAGHCPPSKSAAWSQCRSQSAWPFTAFVTFLFRSDRPRSGKDEFTGGDIHLPAAS